MTDLSLISTLPPEGTDEEQIRDLTKDLTKELGDLHQILMAQKKYSVLIVLQGMDASGKDGAVKTVFEYCTHQSLRAYNFKKPSEEEFSHDFLWRVHKQAPAKGEIVVFVRSHYEDILIQRVHRWIDEDRAHKRMAAINAFEQLLAQDNNTLVLKFFLHISKKQQEEELLERKQEKDKMWKHNPNDWKEREHWDEYMRCYEYAIDQSLIPWTIVPVDKRWYRDYIIARELVTQLRKLNLEYPGLPKGI